MSLEGVDFGMRTLVGILAGGLANFMLGGLWYMLLFRDRWMAATGRTAEEFEGGSPGGGMLLTLGGCIVTTAVLAVVYDWGGGETLLDGLVAGALLGAGVAAVEGLKPAVYNVDERTRPWALYAVNGSYAVCGMVLAGVVYALVI